jgi:hypothetical protein
MKAKVSQPRIAAIYIRVSSEHQAEKSSPKNRNVIVLNLQKK